MMKRTFRVGWLATAPVKLPTLAEIWDDLAKPGAEAIALHLAAPLGSVQRWLREGKAPRPVELALFYESRFGRSLVAHDADRDARLLGACVMFLQRENERLTQLVGHLGVIGEFGAANAPVHDGIEIDWAFASQLAQRNLRPLPIQPTHGVLADLLDQAGAGAVAPGEEAKRRKRVA